ncbi:MAG TPA: tyrosine-type recombinase/integrase [Gemmatimonadaceae bacterium]|nr:tyrosine-type recombinase/integrase [Gemmatimonadaceae bacterium]
MSAPSSPHEVLTMPKLRNDEIESRLRARRRGGPARYYADFRDYKDVGGKIEKLCPPGEQYATTSEKDAKDLAKARLAKLQERRALRPTGDPAKRTFAKFAAHHLEQKALNGVADEPWLEAAQRHLEVARDYFGEKRDLMDIQVSDVADYMKCLNGTSNGRGGTLSAGTVVQYLNSLSSMYRRAISEGLVLMGQNPVAALIEKPKIRRTKTLWLEIAEMANILKAAYGYVPSRQDLAIPYFFQVLATTALSGCRQSEVWGLEVSDINLDRGIIRVRENEWRRLKTDNSERPVPIFPQLAEILYAFLNGEYAPKGKLAFASCRTEDGQERMITDLRKMYDKMPMPTRFLRDRTEREMAKLEAERQKRIERWTNAGRGPKPKQSLEELQLPLEKTVLPRLRSRMLRHTYCAARLQTTDNGKAIAMYTVAQEMGHEDLKMIKKVYGHLGKFRPRGEHVEFRW